MLFWTRTWDAIAGVVFPTGCVSCGSLIAAHDPPLCGACWDRVGTTERVACRCGGPSPGSTGADCGRCRRGLSVISAGIALGPYSGPLKECVVALKYHGRHKTADRLAERLSARAGSEAILGGADALVPVPLHPARLRHRGYNQAELLAEAVAKRASVPVRRALARLRDTSSQTALGSRQRRLNVRGAFDVRRGGDIDGQKIVLVDDVVTTGATARECARTLLEAGAREVRLIAVARAE